MPSDKLKVLFVCERPDLRSYKMAKGLLATGECEPLLLAAGWDRALHGPAFASAREFGSAFSASFFAFRRADLVSRGRARSVCGSALRHWLRPKIDAMRPFDILHSMTPPVQLSRLAIACSGAPAVFDQYDLILQSYGKDYMWPSEIADERWCFEHAQGFVHKGPASEIQFYRDRGYTMDGPELSYPDGCDESFFKPLDSPKLSDADGEWHVAYAGGIHGPGKPFDLLRDFSTMAAQGIHVHIYPAIWSEGHEDLSQYAKAGGKIHLHKSLPYAELAGELAKYDFGIYYWDIAPTTFPDVARKVKTAAGNKVPAYYEAGLPAIVGSSLEYTASMVSEAGAGLIVDAGELGTLAKMLDGADLSAMKKGVAAARERLSVKSQGRALLEFYRKLLAARNI